MADRTWEQSEGLARRFREVSPGEFADETYVRDAWSAAVGLGRAYLLGTGRLSLGLAGSVRALVSNPANSGAIVSVLAMTAMATSTGWATVYRNPTTGLPSTERIRQNVNPAHGHPGAARLLADTSTTTPLSGGIEGVTLGLPASERADIGPLGLVLLPGESLGVSSSFGAGADLAAVVYVVETPI